MTNNCFSTWNQVPIQFFGANLNCLGKISFEDNTPQVKSNNAFIPYVSAKLDEEQKVFQRYKENLEKWERKKKEINGDKYTQDTISYYEDKIDFIKTIIPSKLEQLRKERLEKINMVAMYLQLIPMQQM